MTSGLTRESKIINAIEYIESQKKTIAPVLQDKKLIGTISDGDIRRAILNSKSVSDSIEGVFNTNPIFAQLGTSEDELKKLLTMHSVEAIPIVNSEKNFLKIVHLSDLVSAKANETEYKKKIENLTALILAGGKGRRLLPLTKKIPKPMVKVGDMPIIERQIRRLLAMGIEDIIVSTNYLGEIIEDYFTKNSPTDVKIKFIREEEYLGTAGPISLMPDFENLLLVNGDLLSDVNYVEMLKYHEKYQSVLTIGAVNHHIDIPYGVLSLDGEEFDEITEKPSQTFLCNAGIYLMTKEIVKFLFKNEYLDMTELIRKLKKSGSKIEVFPIHEKWIDIGNREQLDFANKQISQDIK